MQKMEIDRIKSRYENTILKNAILPAFKVYEVGDPK